MALQYLSKRSSMDFKVIAVDFDGTLCENHWPDIGAPNVEVINYIKCQKLAGSKIILWTCRTDGDLKNALTWCKKQGLEFDAVNSNIPEAIELYGSDSRKIYADEYIDDKMSVKFKLPFIKRRKEELI